MAVLPWLKSVPRFLLLALYGLLAIAEANDTYPILPIADFTRNDLSQWKAERFSGETQYQLQENQAGITVLCAHSKRSASGLVREISVDLEKTPYLNWSWRIEHAFQDHDEKTKAGDDYPARVYVLVDDGLFFWQTKALNYVWAGQSPVDSVWISPYISDQVRLIAIESGNAKSRQWLHEKRNVLEDLKRAFQKKLTRIDAVAIMTDTDNTGKQAQACYGDIFFSAQ